MIALQSVAIAEGARYSVSLGPDANVVSGETIIRFLLDAQRGISVANGARLNTCRLQPLCSYPSTLPMILVGSGIEIAYHPFESLVQPFYWKSPDGSTICSRYLATDAEIPAGDSCPSIDSGVSATRSMPIPDDSSECKLPNTLVSIRHLGVENALTVAEKLWGMAYVLGSQPPAEFADLWKLAYYPAAPNTYVRPSPRPLELLFAAAKSIADKIDTHGSGTPIVVFNTLSWTRTDAVDVSSPFPGKRVNIQVTDSTGKRFAGQSIGDRLYFTARDVPPMGYKVFWVNRVAQAVSGRLSSSTNGIIENEFFRVECSTQTGWVKRIYDKVARKELLPTGRVAAQLIVRAENDGRNATHSTVILTKSEVVGMLPGPARANLVSDQRYSRSQITREITLYDAVPRIDFRFSIDWQEARSKDKVPVRLCAAFSGPKGANVFLRDSLFGTTNGRLDGTFAPSRHFAALAGKSGGLLVMTNGCPGFAYSGGAVFASLAQSLTPDDLVYDQDSYEINFGICPFGGTMEPAKLFRRSSEFNEPLLAISVDSHKGGLVPQRSVISVSAPNLIVTAFKKAEDANAVVMRVRETDGKETKAQFTVRWMAGSAQPCDLMEHPVGEPLTITEEKFESAVGSYRLSSFLIPIEPK